VYGWEVVPEAVEDARRNAADNGITNATFRRGDLARLRASLGPRGLPGLGGGGKRGKRGDGGGGSSGGGRGSEDGVKEKYDRNRDTTVAAEIEVEVEVRAGVGSEKTDLPQPDIVIADPARAGMDKSLVTVLRSIGARRVVYVSCNPATQARDILGLCGGGERGGVRGEDDGDRDGDSDGDGDGDDSAGGGSGSGGGRRLARYRLVSCTPVDMFPHTPHVETVAVLDKVEE
jgi:tRNA/tmRNA/rRNA uracil-C5-methylase (TrmA/RlmC/RlmD family)